MLLCSPCTRKVVLGVSGLLVPGEQFCLVGVGGEPTDGMDTRADLDVFAKDTHMLGAVDDTASQRTLRRIANKHDTAMPAAVFLQFQSNAG